MKLLILTNQIPYPLDSGGNVAQYMFIDYLRHKIHISMIFEIKNDVDKHNFNELKNRWNNVELIAVDNPEYTPEYQYSFFAKLELAIKRRFRRFWNSKSEIPIKISEPTIFDLALWYLRPVSKKYIETVERFISSTELDLIQIEQVPYLSLSCLDTKIPKIYVHHELQTELLNSAKSNYQIDDLFTNYTIDLTRTLEVSLLRNFDATIVFSDSDKVKLESFGLSNIYNIPFAYDSNSISSKDIPFTNFTKLTFVGGDGHFPNVDAIEWYYKELGKAVYEGMNLKLHVIGNWKEKNRKLFDCDYIVFEGFRENLQIALSGGINLVPLRLGSGIRTKILSAFGHKVPVVSTAIGIEGIEVEIDTHYKEFHDVKSLIVAINSILENQVYANQIVNEAYTNLVSKYNISYLSEKRMNVYNSLLNSNK